METENSAQYVFFAAFLFYTIPETWEVLFLY